MDKILKVLVLLIILFVVIGVSNGKDNKKEETEFIIDYDSLNADRKDEIKEIVKNNTVVRTLKDIKFEIKMPILLFMFDHPIFLSAILRAMKIGNYVINQGENETYNFDDSKGLTGNYEEVFSDENQRYFFGNGKFDGWLINLVGSGLVLTKFRAILGTDNLVYMDAKVYSKIDNLVIGVLMKILKPIVIPLIDRKIKKLIGKVQELKKEITDDPEKIYNILKENGYENHEELEEFKRIVIKNSEPNEKLQNILKGGIDGKLMP